MPLTAGQSLSSYEILGPLGAGGMSDVYRARDKRLEREVALKVLAPEAAAEPDHLERFLREARVLASLDHPNIVVVHSVEESGGLHFLTMALVPGRSLDSLIPEDGMVPTELLPLARSMAEGVSAAHAHGIVHRDLKPANVMVTGEGQVKIVDFGLARAEVPTDRSMELTGMGAAVGTIPYMSPEQLRGAAVDARSDLFSMGVVLYEMATGKRPFAGDSAADVISSILNDEPKPLTDVCRERTPGLERVIRRCLQKDPDDRYSSIGELIRDLPVLEESARPETSREAARVGEHWIAGRAEGNLPLPARPSLAVLPFRNLSGDPEQQHLATGLWFDLNAELMRLAGLFLLNATSTATLEGQNVDPRQAGRELGVRHVLEGSVRRAGKRIRITVHLVETETGLRVWADHFDSTVDELFDVQDEINEKVLAALEVQLLYGEGARTMRSTSKNPRVRDLLYRALPLSFSSKPEDLERARGLLDDVEREEPGLTQTYSTLGWTHYFEARAGWCRDPEQAFERAKSCAAKAIEVGDPSGMGHMLIAAVHLIQGEHARAREAGRIALDLRPGCPWAYAVLGHLYNYIGDPQQAIQLASRAIRLSPLVPDLFPAALATGYYFLDRPRDAVSAARSAIELDPDSLDAHVILLAALVASREEAATAPVVAQIRRIKPGFALDEFAQTQPYQDAAQLAKLVTDLRRAGL